MQKINQFSFYTLGQTFKALEAYKKRRDDIPAGEIFWDLHFAESQTGTLLKGHPLPLSVSKKSAEEVYNALKSVMDEYFTDEDGDQKKVRRFPKDGDPAIPYWRLHSVFFGLEKFQTIFSEEMREAATYFVPRRGIFDTAALVDTADETFPEELRPYIPQKTNEEWKSAGRCLAFGMYSASGFHVARAVEGALEKYFQFYTKKNLETLRTWGDYLKELDNARNNTPHPSEKTLAELRQMKDDYRNPIMHPRVILSESDARMLFSNGESLIIAMAQEIKQETQKSTKKGILTALAGGAV